MTTSHVNEEMRAAVGQVVEWRVSFPIAASDIRRWAIAVHYPQDPPRRFWDEEHAVRSHGAFVAPEEFNPFAWMVAERMAPATAPLERDTDRLEKAVGITGPGLGTQLNAGSRVVYGVPMAPGDVIRSETRIRSYEERAGRMGLMLITSTDVLWTNQRGEIVLTGADTSIRY